MHLAANAGAAPDGNRTFVRSSPVSFVPSAAPSWAGGAISVQGLPVAFTILSNGDPPWPSSQPWQCFARHAESSGVWANP
jgi:hypothetical protein